MYTIHVWGWHIQPWAVPSLCIASQDSSVGRALDWCRDLNVPGLILDPFFFFVFFGNHWLTIPINYLLVHGNLLVMASNEGLTSICLTPLVLLKGSWLSSLYSVQGSNQWNGELWCESFYQYDNEKTHCVDMTMKEILSDWRSLLYFKIKKKTKGINYPNTF